MTSVANDSSANIPEAFAAFQTQAAKVIARLYDRSAYVNEEEFAEIMSLVKALRKISGLPGK